MNRAEDPCPGTTVPGGDHGWDRVGICLFCGAVRSRPTPEPDRKTLREARAAYLRRQKRNRR